MKPKQQRFGAIPKAVVWILAALVVGGYMALKLYRSGASNIGYIIAISVATVVAGAIVAPNLFSGDRQSAGDWSKDVKDLRASPSDQSQKEPGNRGER